MRQAHYWKQAGAKSAPSEIVVFDSETWHGARAACPGGELHTLRLGCALAYRLEGAKRTRVQRLVYRSAEEFWNFVRSRLNPHRPVWVFAHNIGYDLGTVAGWRFLTSDEFECDKLALSGQLTYISGRTPAGKLVFCDTINYYRCPLQQLGMALGLEKLPMPEQDAPDSEWERYCWRDVEVCAAGIDHLRAFIGRESLGPWQPSIAGLAFSAYRSRFMTEKVLVHSYKHVLDMERQAYYGGLVDTPRVGDVPASPVYELDVCSMYPHVCTLSLPTKIVNQSVVMGVQGIKRYARDYMLCADVEIVSDTSPYPVKGKRGTYFATGRFRTCLPHPELMHAIDNGHVKSVYRVAWYQHAPIFAEYMRYFTALKSQYRKDGNEAFATLCKYYANNLYGKTGQLSPKWREWGQESLEVLEDTYGLGEGALEKWYRSEPVMMDPEETHRFPGVPEPIPIRDYYGVVEIKVGETESRESCPVIAGTVTSYARLLLRRCQAIAGNGHWFYSDTDSIWTDEQGMINLQRAGMIDNERLGFLSLKGVHQRMRVHGPKDYETDTVRRVKGVRASAVATPDGGWAQLQFPSPLTQVKDNIESGVFVRHIVKHLRRTLTKCKVDSEGSTRPLVFPAENPELAVVRKRRAR